MSLYLNGVKVYDIVQVGSYINLPDGIELTFGTGKPATAFWEVADADANCLMIELPAGGSVDVPVVVLGVAIDGADLTFFNGKTFPLFAVVDNDKDSWIALGFSADDAALLQIGGSAALTLPAFTAGNITLAAGGLITWGSGALLRYHGTSDIIHIRDAANTHYGGLYCSGIALYGGGGGQNDLYFGYDAASISSLNSDSGHLVFLARDNGVGTIEIMRMQCAADPYLQIGRDDTGVALNAVTDMLVLRAGGGTGNEAANFGLGISLVLGNASSEVEERASWDTVLVTATNGAEDARFDWSLMSGGTMNLAMALSATGVLSVDLGGSGAAAQVDLFDDYDDALILKQGIQQNNRELLANMGILERKDTGSGYMMKIQPMLRLLAGGIYQTRQTLEDMKQDIVRRIEALERSIA